jgi:hypothetical protein
LKGRKTDEGEREEIRGAALVQDLSGMLSVREVESESAAIARGLDLLSKILVSDSGCIGACWGGKRVAGGAAGVGVGRKGSIMERSVYARRPVCLAR